MISATLLLCTLSANGGLPQGFAVVDGSTINIAVETWNDKRFALISGTIESNRNYLQIVYDLMPPRLFNALGRADAVIKSGGEYFNLYKII